MTFFLLLCMLYEMSGRRRTGVDLSALHVQMKYAPVMELVDMRDLGSRAAMRVGSSPFRRTKKKDMTFGHVFLFGAAGGNRTHNLLITSEMLCH